MSPITHAFTSAKSDGADPTELQPSHWNADHIGGSRVVDLGVILAADCTGGNSVDLQPLIGANVGDAVHLLIVNADFVQHDSDLLVVIGGYGDPGEFRLLDWGPSNITPAKVVQQTGSGYYTGAFPYVEDGQPLLMSGAGSLATVGAIHLKAVVTSA